MMENSKKRMGTIAGIKEGGRTVYGALLLDESGIQFIKMKRRVIRPDPREMFKYTIWPFLTIMIYVIPAIRLGGKNFIFHLYFLGAFLALIAVALIFGDFGLNSKWRSSKLIEHFEKTGDVDENEKFDILLNIPWASIQNHRLIYQVPSLLQLSLRKNEDKEFFFDILSKTGTNAYHDVKEIKRRIQEFIKEHANFIKDDVN